MSRVRAAVTLLIGMALAGCAPFHDAGEGALLNTALQKARDERAAAAASFTKAILRYCAVRYETDGDRQACQTEKRREVEERIRSHQNGRIGIAGLYVARPEATGSSLRCRTTRGHTDCELPRSSDVEAWRGHLLQ